MQTGTIQNPVMFALKPVVLPDTVLPTFSNFPFTGMSVCHISGQDDASSLSPAQPFLICLADQLVMKDGCGYFLLVLLILLINFLSINYSINRLIISDVSRMI